ncbi:MAG TPA: flagellar filament capping protein FliD [Bryobacteraceae bacterium]|nr:flagellar filament capping protein FliD [Bryobacteraceae bacterium]
MGTSLTPLTFTGVSQFSNDFQTILSRAVSIASLPVQSLQNQQADILQKKQLTTDLGVAFRSLTDSVTALANLGANGALSAVSSDPSKVSVISTTTATGSNYDISDITSIAKAAAECSLSGYTSPDATAVSSTGTLELIAGTQKYEIALGSNNNTLAGLRDAINQLGAGVTASILATGTGDQPYYLSVTADQTGATTLRLVDDPNGSPKELLTSQNQGSDAAFLLNGVAVDQPSNLIQSVVPGLSFEILGTTSSDQTVTLSMSPDRSKIAAALQDLVTQYNNVAGKVNAQIGPNAGLLSGSSLVRDVQNSLRQLTQYHGSGSGDIQSFADLGIELSDSGQMSFNADKLNALSDSDLSAAISFLGTPGNGLSALASSFNQITDPVSGEIKLQQDEYDTTDQQITSQVNVLTERINNMQASLSSKLQAADAQLAQLESQQTMLQASIQSLNYTLYGQQQQNTQQ